MMRDVTALVIVGCGSAKHDGVLPAKEKYSSPYFSLKRSYAEAVGTEWAILSAEHGLIDPETEIDDYDRSVSEMPASRRAAWGNAAGTSIVARCADMESDGRRPDELHLLLGSDYKTPISETVDWLAGQGIRIVDPFAGTSGIHEQQSLLSDAVTFAGGET